MPGIKPSSPFSGAEESGSHSPWFAFFVKVRELAAQLDARELDAREAPRAGERLPK